MRIIETSAEKSQEELRKVFRVDFCVLQSICCMYCWLDYVYADCFKFDIAYSSSCRI